MPNMIEKLKRASDFLSPLMKGRPKVGVVLGSGLGAFVENVEDKVIVPYRDIPHFHQTTVEGHEGRLILGNVEGVPVAILQGRLHAYEGHPMEDVVFPVRLIGLLGIEALVLTNAAGGINTSFRQGDLVCISDHVNLMGQNPLTGPNMSELGPRFPDMTHAYNPGLQQLLMDSAAQLGLTLKKGVYAGVLGPTYETPAEVRMLRAVGCDMVGMSTVPEAIAANHLGIKVCGVSCITNMAAGIVDAELKHEDIKAQALKVMERFSSLLKRAIAGIQERA